MDRKEESRVEEEGRPMGKIGMEEVGKGKRARNSCSMNQFGIMGMPLGLRPHATIHLGLFFISTHIGVLLGLVSSRVRNTQRYVDY